MPIPSQKIITKDNVSIDVAAVAYFKVVDATKSIIAIQDVYSAVNQLHKHRPKYCRTIPTRRDPFRNGKD